MSLKLSLPPTDLSTLHHLHALLHLAHHRNKNQHRRSHWYRHLSLLRRHLATLLTFYDLQAEEPDTFSARHRKKTQDKLTREKVRLELEYLQDVLMPRAWSRFSQLVADGRFAVLGTVLVGMLGEVGRVTGVTGAIDEEGQREVERVLEVFGREWDGEGERRDVKREEEGKREDRGNVVSRENGREDRGEALSRAEGEVVDLGVAVEREAVGGAQTEVVPAQVLPEDTDDVEEENARVDAVLEPRKKRRSDGEGKVKVKKRKKKGGDAIDDLFAGL
ncbi:Hypothetical protein D9617_13g101260 [Elsinoe fawcettii]|nr:Hypothetical protein D9617_13g101260 [Elsinoe fawcettii]